MDDEEGGVWWFVSGAIYPEFHGFFLLSLWCIFKDFLSSGYVLCLSCSWFALLWLLNYHTKSV